MVVGTVDSTDYGTLDLTEQIRRMEIEGYCVFPSMLSPREISELKEAASRWPTVGRDYSERQRSCKLLHNNPTAADVPALDDEAPGDSEKFGFISQCLRDGSSGAARTASLIAHQPTLAFLRQLLGSQVVCFSFNYDRSEVGTPGLSLHAGAKPFGARVSGTHYVDISSPCYLRALYYLDDLTLDVSPFRILPRSHISLHCDANPYLRYEDHREQVIVTLKAGSMILFHERCFHGTLPNTGDRDRAVLALGYRPAWAGPIASVTEFNPSELHQLPTAVQDLIRDPNTHDGVVYSHLSKPEGMARAPSHIGPSRHNGPRL